jgi:anti-anti-sigma regulatory factor
MSDQPGEYFRWTLQDGVAVVEVLARELNQPWFAQEFGAGLRELLTARPSDRFLIDFHRTEAMSSTAFAALFDFARAASAAQARVAICGMSPAVRFGAEILSLDQFIPFTDDEADGLATLRAAGP